MFKRLNAHSLAPSRMPRSARLDLLTDETSSADRPKCRRLMNASEYADFLNGTLTHTDTDTYTEILSDILAVWKPNNLIQWANMFKSNKQYTHNKSGGADIHKKGEGGLNIWNQRHSRLCNYALHKYTIDIDIDIDVKGRSLPWKCCKRIKK